MRVMFFLQPGTNSRDIFRDMIDGFERSGCETLIWELKPVWDLYQRHQPIRQALMSEMASIVGALIRSNRVDLSVGMWANSLFSQAAGSRDGRPATLFDLIEHPHLLFWLDAPHWAHEGGLSQHFGSGIFNGPSLHHLINNAGLAREMREVLGFGNVASLPYGVNERVFRPCRTAREFDLVFGLGPGDRAPTPAMLEELDADEPDTQRIRIEQADLLKPRLETLAQRVPGVAREEACRLLFLLLDSQLCDRHRPMLDRLDVLSRHDAALARACDGLKSDPRVFLKATSAIRRIEQWERAFTITYLSRRFRCATFGGGDLAAWGCSATHLGSLPYADQARAFGRAPIALNVMRWQDDVGVNIKPMEIAASGAVCLMRHRAGIESLYEPDREIVTFETPSDAAESLRQLLDDPDRLDDIREAALRRTLRDHTWTTRVQDIVSSIGLGRQADRLSPVAA